MLAEGVHLRIANRPVQIGRENAMIELATTFSGVVALGRSFRAFWPGRDRETLLMELELLPYGGQPIPLALILRTLPDQPLIQDLRFYADLSPLRPRRGPEVLQ